MKKYNLKFRTAIFVLFFSFISVFSIAQNTIYSENFGTPTANTLVQNYHGWQNTDVIYTASATCDIRSSAASADYSLASGGGNLYLNDTLKWFMISRINTTTADDLSLYIGLRKVNAENGSNLMIEVSEDSIQWSRLWMDGTLPTGTGTSGWYRVRYPHVPSSAHLHIRFSNLTNVEYRIDDIALVVGEETVTETVLKPTFSPAAGTYYESKEVTITSATEGATIYYTMDGSTPTSSSNRYEGPLTINNSVTVNAIAFHENMTESNVSSANYIILDTNSLVSLPFNISTNSTIEQQDITLMEGFRGYYLGSSYADGSVKFEANQANKAKLVAHLDSSPASLSFDLKGKNGGSNPAAYQGIALEVLESPDGSQWNSLATYTEEVISVDSFSHFTDISLHPNTRFIAWRLNSAEKGNTQLNNITITKHSDDQMDTTSIIDYITHTFSLFPNPTNIRMFYDAGKMHLVSLHLMTLNGVKLKSWYTQEHTGEILFNGIPKGIYLLKIVTTEGVMTRKVVKQ